MRGGSAMRRTLAFIMIIFASLLLFYPSPTHAGIIDKIKAIYNTPEKVDDMLNQYEIQYERTKQQFEDTQKALQEQQQKYLEAEQRAAEFLKQQQELQAVNEQYRSDNEKLIAQNSELAQQLALVEQQQADRKALMRKLIVMGITVVALILGYFALIRIWRYLVWRRQRADQRGPHS